MSVLDREMSICVSAGAQLAVQGFPALASDAAQEGELAFAKGEELIVTDQGGGGVDRAWYSGYRAADATRTVGTFPGNYVRKLQFNLGSGFTPPPPQQPPPPQAAQEKAMQPFTSLETVTLLDHLFFKSETVAKQVVKVNGSFGAPPRVTSIMCHRAPKGYIRYGVV